MNHNFEKRVSIITVSVFAVVLICVTLACLILPGKSLSQIQNAKSPLFENILECGNQTSGGTIFSCKAESPLSNSCITKSSKSNTSVQHHEEEERVQGSRIQFEECNPADFTEEHCHGLDPTKEYECIHGECALLHGLFNCTKKYSPTGDPQGALCRNLTSTMFCEFNTTDIPIVCNTKKACLYLDGLYQCHYGECARIRPPFLCYKRYTAVRINYENVVQIYNGESLHTAKCAKARDPDTGIDIWSRSSNQNHPSYLIFCKSKVEVSDDKTKLSFTDCLEVTK